QVCRHKAADLSLAVRPDGYLVLSEVLGCKMLEKFKATPEQVERIVRDNDKQRFTLAVIDGKRFIRANQGHSMKGVSDDLLLDRLWPGGANLPSQVVHGTYARHWSSILERGLLAGGKQGAKFRNHVHFATGLPADDGPQRHAGHLRPGHLPGPRRRPPRGAPPLPEQQRGHREPGLRGRGARRALPPGGAVSRKDGAQIWPEG
ncbi:unnamed protein product, partial [Prorocentrum cordatum]